MKTSFKHADNNQVYWDNYIAVQPEYDDLFYQSIYKYYELHRGCVSEAHDVATGPGQVAAALTSHFDRVITSDINNTYLSIAKERLKQLIASNQVELIHLSAEEIAHIYPPSSADMITAAECLPLMDAPKTLQAFSKLLKPSGTLAIWFYGRPIFAESDFAASCQPLFDSLENMMFAKYIKGSPRERRVGWKRSTDAMASFLDHIQFPDSMWQDVHRRKWNYTHPDALLWTRRMIQRSSAIGPKEEIVEKEDLTFWERQWKVDDAKRFIMANLPTFEKEKWDENVEETYKELKIAMGGEHAVRNITWPVVLILASRR